MNRSFDDSAFKPSSTFVFSLLIAMADSKIKDMGLAEFGRKELTIADYEMSGLMNCRKEYGQPVAGLNNIGSLHMTIQT